MMKRLSLFLAAICLLTMSCPAAWSYRWGSWYNGYSPYGLMNAARYLVPYGNGGYYNGYNNYNPYNNCRSWNYGQWRRHHHPHRYWW